MPYYVSRYVGSGTHASPFRPALWGAAQPKGTIDLRPDPTQVNGVAFCFSPDDVTGPSFVKIAEDKAEQLSTLVNRRLYQELLVPERAVDVDLITTIRELLFNPPVGAWKALLPARGVREIWMAGQLFWADGVPTKPVPGTISDSFTRANETPAAAPWIKLTGGTGTINLVSNALAKVTQGDFFAYHDNNGLGWNADQSAQWDVTTLIPNDDWGPAVRIGSNNFSGYIYEQVGELSKVVNGAYSAIEASASRIDTTGTAKIDVSGSTLRYYIGGVEDANSPGTDTSLTTAGLGAGVFWFEATTATGNLDNAVLTGEVIASPSTPLNQRSRRLFPNLRPRPFSPSRSK